MVAAGREIASTSSSGKAEGGTKKGERSNIYLEGTRNVLHHTLQFQPLVLILLKFLTFQSLLADQGAVRPHPHSSTSTNLHLVSLPSLQSPHSGGVARCERIKWGMLRLDEWPGFRVRLLPIPLSIVHLAVVDIVADNNSIPLGLWRRLQWVGRICPTMYSIYMYMYSNGCAVEQEENLISGVFQFQGSEEYTNIGFGKVEGVLFMEVSSLKGCEC